MGNRTKLSTWVEEKHGYQTIKNTSTPYFKHVLNVANSVDATAPFGYEIGLCHDLLEDTDVKKKGLIRALTEYGYSESEVASIVRSVTELTDVFTKKDFPYLNKSERKELESRRLITISAVSQTVKYADLNDNISWMELHDLKHLKKYLTKKLALITGLDKGDINLRQQVISRMEKLLVRQLY